MKYLIRILLIVGLLMLLFSVNFELTEMLIASLISVFTGLFFLGVECKVFES